MPSDSADAQRRLRAAWDELIQRLQEARDAIDTPALMPPPASERNLAEGYRYLMGHVHAAVERAFHADPARPHFRNALSIVTRGTIDNADAIYFYAPIDGRRSYLLRGESGDARHWRGDPPAAAGRRAPHYLIFETSWGPLAGDSGSLSELRPGMKTQTGRIDSSELALNADGSFEILFAPVRPAGFAGNFVPTLKVVSQPHPSDPSIPPQRYANYVSGRQLFYDWEREDAIHFEMVPLDADADAPSAYTAERAAQELRRFGEIVRGQVHFWNAFWTIPMGTYGPRPGTLPGIGFPRNAFNRINAASGATGGGMSTNLYAGGIAELGDDEALIVENRVQLAPQYVGFQLGNLWGESLEYANRCSSRNGHQSVVDADGVIRLVIAHEDPGVHNWLDTTGQPVFFMSPRWAYSKTPEPPDWPTISMKVVKRKDVLASLPPDTKRVTPEERRQEIAVRQRHVVKRYRVF
jgi:hypothetical protein